MDNLRRHSNAEFVKKDFSVSELHVVYYPEQKLLMGYFYSAYLSFYFNISGVKLLCCSWTASCSHMVITDVPVVSTIIQTKLVKVKCIN